jgi:hypothetical protein
MSFLKKKIRNLFFRVISPVTSFLDFSLDSRVADQEIKSFLKRIHPKESIKPLIRIGPDGDGGYLLPDDLGGIVACFSPGVDQESRFELQLAERGMEVFLADYSVEKSNFEHSRFHFTRKFIGAMDHGIYMSLDTWVKESLPHDSNSDLLLQMDIEGFEYESIFSMSQTLLNRFRFIVIEFHSFDRIFERVFFHNLNRIFDKLLINHSIVHIHPNNYKKPVKINGIDIPTFLEITLGRNERVHPHVFVKPGPHPLDQNNVMKETVTLSELWYH